MSDPLRHHFVAQLYLRHFASNSEKTKIFLIDRTTLPREQAISKVAVQRELYTSKREADLGRLEAAVAPILTRLNEASTAFHITRADKWILSEFVTSQIVRSPAHIDNMIHMEKGINVIIGDAYGQTLTELLDPSVQLRRREKERFMVMALDQVPDMRPYVMKKHLLLMRVVDDAAHLITSDEPVCFIKNRGVPRALGAGIDNSSLYFPIGKKVGLLLIDTKRTSHPGSELVDLWRVGEEYARDMNSRVVRQATKTLFSPVRNEHTAFEFRIMSPTTKRMTLSKAVHMKENGDQEILIHMRGVDL